MKEPKMDLKIKPDLTLSKEDISNFKKLTPSEKQVLQWVAAGKTQNEIGIILGISANTVMLHTSNIRNKLNKTNMTEVVRIWMQLVHTEQEEFNEGSGI